MANRSHNITAVGEYYHCYNRGTEKRIVFTDEEDFSYFIKSLISYNSIITTGKLRLSEKNIKTKPLVTIISYCLLPNHYHLVLKNEIEGGISKFLQRVSTGYTLYFNKKHDRSGALFQGKFKSKPLYIDQDLKHVIAYVYFNHKIHSITNSGKYRSFLDTQDDLVRGWTSNLCTDNLREIVQIIKLARLDIE